MKREQRYGTKSLERDFPTEEACLDFIFDAQHSRQCSCGGTYKLRVGRKQYQCSKCRASISPTAGTIFHKSDTPLTLWFKAILAFSNAKSGLSAKQLEREIETTYKTAWRMLSLIRKALKQDGRKLSGIVESDVAIMGGKVKYRKDETRGEALLDKAVVIGAIERGGEVRVERVADKSTATHKAFIEKTVDPENTVLMTDAAPAYEGASKNFLRVAVNHNKKEYVRGNAHVNTMESFWSHVKRSIKGTHKTVSKKYLQAYLNGFAFHWNNAYSDKQRFAVLLGTVSLSGG